MKAKTNGHTNLAGFESSSAAIMAPTFVITRAFDAPKKRVYEAWADPKQMAMWWGPKGFTVPVCEMDLRPGGSYRIVMRSIEGVDYPLKGVFQEIIEGERLVYTSNWEEHPANWQEMLRNNGANMFSKEALNTVTFNEQNGRTLVTIKTVFNLPSFRDAMLKTGMEQGWSESLDRLAELLSMH